MSSTFGHQFKITTWGESHGPALGVVIEGCPAGLELDVEDIQKDLNRRRVGQSIITSTRNEQDRAEVLSGIYEGVTTGAPISLITYNADQRSKNYDNLKDVFRPCRLHLLGQVRASRSPWRWPLVVTGNLGASRGRGDRQEGARRVWG
jgi:chorismate synthase